MLYEYNNKIYVKPFSNKLVEVEISREANEYNVKATNRSVELTMQNKGKVTDISLEEAYKMSQKKIIDTL